MSLRTWLSEESGRGRKLAAHINVPPSFVSKMASGERPVPIEHGAAIEAFTDGSFSRREYWPETYARIWPELATAHVKVERPDLFMPELVRPAGAPNAGEVAHA